MIFCIINCGQPPREVSGEKIFIIIDCGLRHYIGYGNFRL